jgi:hypothetical protein
MHDERQGRPDVQYVPCASSGFTTKVANSGDVVIGKQDFSIVDTHEPEFAISLPPCHTTDWYCDAHRNQIFQVGRHQGVRRFVSPSHHVSQQSLIAGCHGVKDLPRLHSVRSFLVRRPFFQSVSLENGNLFNREICPRAAGQWWKGEGGAGVLDGET